MCYTGFMYIRTHQNVTCLVTYHLTFRVGKLLPQYSTAAVCSLELNQNLTFCIFYGMNYESMKQQLVQTDVDMLRVLHSHKDVSFNHSPPQAPP